jgi:hypothetical protein
VCLIGTPVQQQGGGPPPVYSLCVRTARRGVEQTAHRPMCVREAAARFGARVRPRPCGCVCGGWTRFPSCDSQKRCFIRFMYMCHGHVVMYPCTCGWRLKAAWPWTGWMEPTHPPAPHTRGAISLCTFTAPSPRKTSTISYEPVIRTIDAPSCPGAWFIFEEWPTLHFSL